jgi:hypothetical protein
MLPKILDLQLPQQTQQTATKQGKSFLFDFATGDFVLMDGRLAEADQTTALKIWIEKVLRTELNRFQIYDGKNYGVMVEDLVGQSLPFSFVESEIRREINNSLLQHPLINSVSNFVIERTGSKLNVSFVVNNSIGQEVSFIV